MYKRYADGRCGALLEIDPDSPEQFLAWLDHKVPCDHDLGDHPWEIKRGGNTTHIDLYVYRPHSYNWYKPGDEKYDFGRARRQALPFVSWAPMPILLPR